MANQLFAGYKAELLGDADGPGHGTVDFEADTIKASLLDATDSGTVDPTNMTTYADYDDVDTPTVVAVATLGTKTVALSTGTATVDAADTTFTTVTGDPADYIVIWKDSTVASTSLLIVFFDTASGLPVTPNGGDIVVAWNASGIFTW